MLRALGLCAAFGLGLGLAAPAPPAEPSPTCCKICRKGKACGDSCIARSKDCSEPKGCACNEADLRES